MPASRACLRQRRDTTFELWRGLIAEFAKAGACGAEGVFGGNEQPQSAKPGADTEAFLKLRALIYIDGIGFLGAQRGTAPMKRCQVISQPVLCLQCVRPRLIVLAPFELGKVLDLMITRSVWTTHY